MQKKHIAVIGSGISGLSAAWLVARRHRVTLFEAEARLGGHSNTVEVPGGDGPVGVDTGFIVYNPSSYPNLDAMLDRIGVETSPSNMSFAVSLNDGGYEYSGSGVAGLFGQWRNLARPSHWQMIRDLLRFFEQANNPETLATAETLSLGEFLSLHAYSPTFTRRHILPMAAAIWSTPVRGVLDFPAASFIRFFANHGLLQARNRPVWRTVTGGSINYVERLASAIGTGLRTATPVRTVERNERGARVYTENGEALDFDEVVIAGHADQALAMLGDPDPAERRLLGAFRYVSNRAVLHTDTRAMPRRRRLWSSWNYMAIEKAESERAHLSVTYWMNALQPLATRANYFVTLNPHFEIADGHTIATFDYAHPMFDGAAMQAQRALWSLQGRRRTWFCGSYFGYGFHEDGLQSGLAVAEQLAGVRRPWSVDEESGRIHLGEPPVSAPREAAA